MIKPAIFRIVLLILLLAVLTVTLWLIINSHLSAENKEKSKSVSIQTSIAPSLLYMIASYSFDQFIALQRSLDCLKDICNSGWDVTVHLQVGSKGMLKTHPSYRIIQERMFCVRTNSYMPLIVEEYGNIGFGLNSKHREFAAQHIQDFDYFAYAEEDMLLTPSHLRAFIDAQSKFKQALPDTWMRYKVGFLRYEDSVVGTTERVTWEYMPHQVHIVEMAEGGLGRYIFTNNLNQAIYIFPREQLQDLERRCEFLSRPGQNAFYKELRRAQNLEWKYMSVGVSEWSSSFQQVLQCGLRRLVPAEHFQLFMIHHSTDKAQKRRLRRELLNMQNWTELVRARSLQPISMEQAQRGVLVQQYNLHLMDTARLAGKVKWSWD